MAGRKSDAARVQAAVQLAQGLSYQAAASAAGCSVRTVKRWYLEDKEFRALVDEIIDETLTRTTNLTVQAHLSAVAELAKLLKSKDEGIKVRAARTLVAAGDRLRSRQTRESDDYGDLDRYLDGL